MTPRQQQDSLFRAIAPNEPLAARMRPQKLEEFVGQERVLGPGTPLRESIERGTVGSLILWGPPGSGKTTLGRLVARYTEREFVPFSAVTEGVPRVREIIGEAWPSPGTGVCHRTFRPASTFHSVGSAWLVSTPEACGPRN